MNLSSPFIVFGAGNLGRRVASVVNPESFCDNNRALWGTSIQGIPVESPTTAIHRFPEATFIVAIWNPSPTETMLDRIAHLKNLGATHVVPFTDLLDDYAEHLLPHLLWARHDYYLSHRDEIQRARSLLNENGREEFDRQLRLRSGDFRDPRIDTGIQYFASEIHLNTDEIFVDCGAFDGDTVQQFSRATGGQFRRIIAFEPDPVNLPLLRRAAEADSRISVHPYALGARQQVVHFAAAGPGSHISEQGKYEVQVTTLDVALNEVAPTYIKFDIEGAELDALDGGEQTIRRFRPKLAVCVYHAPDHLWRIPLRLHELLLDAELTLRTYNANGFDCVCYCIPK